jgi:hypothetical protein
METNSKIKVWVYFEKYGNSNHDVLVVRVGSELHETWREHKMYYVHDKHFGETLMDAIKPYLRDEFEVIFTTLEQ